MLSHIVSLLIEGACVALLLAVVVWRVRHDLMTFRRIRKTTDTLADKIIARLRGEETLMPPLASQSPHPPHAGRWQRVKQRVKTWLWYGFVGASVVLPTGAILNAMDRVYGEPGMIYLIWGGMTAGYLYHLYRDHAREAARLRQEYCWSCDVLAPHATGYIVPYEDAVETLHYCDVYTDTFVCKEWVTLGLLLLRDYNTTEE